MTDKGFNLFDKCATTCVHLPLRGEEFISTSYRESKMDTSDRIGNSQRAPTETNRIGNIAKVRAFVEQA